MLTTTEAVVFVARLALDYRMKSAKTSSLTSCATGDTGTTRPTSRPRRSRSCTRQSASTRPRDRFTASASRRTELLDEGPGREDVRGLPPRPRGRPPQARAFAGTVADEFTVDWSHHVEADPPSRSLGRSASSTDALAKVLTKPPAGFTLHPRVARIIDDRARMYADELPLDWGAAETLAYATLLTDDYDVRLTGEDTARGTSSIDTLCCTTRRPARRTHLWRASPATRCDSA